MQQNAKRNNLNQKNSNSSGRNNSGSAAAASTVSSKDLYKSKKKAAAWMHTTDISGCLACFRNHRTRDDFSTCSDKCPICGRVYKTGDNRHLAAECCFMPSDEEGLMYFTVKMSGIYFIAALQKFKNFLSTLCAKDTMYTDRNLGAHLSDLRPQAQKTQTENKLLLII